MRTVKRLIALVLSLGLLLGQTAIVGRTDAADNGVTLDQVYQESSTRLRLRFSEPVGNSGQCFCALRIVDNVTDQNLQWTGGAPDVGSPLQFYGEMDYTYGMTKSGQAMTWTLSTPGNTLNCSTIDEVKALVAPGGAYYGKALMFCMEESGTAVSPGNGLMNGYYAQADSTKCVMATRSTPDGVYVSLTEPWHDAAWDNYMTLDDVTFYDENQVMITFSESNTNAGGYWASIRLVDNVTDQNLQWTGGAPDVGSPLQWGVSFADYHSDQGKKIYGTVSGITYSEILALVADGGTYEGFVPMFSFEESSVTAPGMNGAIDLFTSLTTNLPLRCTKNGYSDGLYVPFRAEEPITLDTVTAVNDEQLVLKFSEPVAVNLNGSADPFMAIRMVDRNDDLVWDGAVGASTPMQFYGTWVWNDNEHTEILWTLNGSNTYKSGGGIKELLSYDGDLAAFADRGYSFKFCIEETHYRTSGQVKGSIDNITDIDGIDMLAASINGQGGNDRLYMPITIGYDGDKLEMISATAINETQIVAEFSEPVSIDGPRPFTAVRMFDQNGALVWDGSDPATAKQWSGDLDYFNESHTKLIFTLHGNNAFGLGNLDEILNYKGLEQFKDDTSILFGFEEINHDDGSLFIANNRLVNNIKSADGKRCLYSSKYTDGLDQVYLPITLDYNNGPLKVDTVSAINDKQIVVTFSAPVTIQGTPYMGLRYIDSNGVLMWTGEIEKSDPLQLTCSWEWYNEAHTQLLLTSRTNPALGIYNISDWMNFAGDLEEYATTARIRLCIEEWGSYIPSNGLVGNIYRTSDAKTLTGVTLPGYLDGAYETVHMGYDAEQSLQMLSATAVNDRQIVLEFSHPIALGNCWTSIRLVGDDGRLVWDGENPDTAAQWGNFAESACSYYNAEHTKVLWTLNGSAYGVTSIVDILNFSGELAQFSGAGIKFCIEEMVENEAFHGDYLITNITALNGTVHLDASLPGGYDGLYSDITLGFTPRAASIVAANAINDKQVVVTFSEGVNISPNKEDGPFFAIRYVDGNGSLRWTGEVGDSVALQFGGDWEWYNDAHTQIIWTMFGNNTAGADDIVDVLDFAGGLAPYSDSNIRFCIEEKAWDGSPIPVAANNGLLENIKTRDGEITLHGSVRLKDWYDGYYGRMNIAFDREKDLTLKSATAINDKEIILEFSQDIAINLPGENKGPYLAVRYLDKKGNLAWTGEINKSIALQFPGTYKYYEDSKDKLIWTMADANTLNANTLTDVLLYSGELADYEDLDVAFCLEEIVYTPADSNDMLVVNVTDADGGRHLRATLRGGYDGAYVPLTVDYELEEPAPEEVDWAEPNETSDTTETGGDVKGNNFLRRYGWAVGLGAGVVAAGAGVGIGMGVRHKKRISH